MQDDEGRLQLPVAISRLAPHGTKADLLVNLPSVIDFRYNSVWQDKEGRLQLPAAICRLAAKGCLSWRNHQKTAIQGPSSRSRQRPEDGL